MKFYELYKRSNDATVPELGHQAKSGQQQLLPC